MAILWLLCIFCLQVLEASAAAARGCDPKEPENDAPVRSCNYYCRENDNAAWKIGYYINGTRCQLDENGPGTCLDMGPEQVGCYPQDSEEVQKFLRSKSGTEAVTTGPDLKKKDKSEKPSKGTKTEEKKKKKKKKPKKSKSKKEKKSSSKKEKKAKTPKTTDVTEPEWFRGFRSRPHPAGTSVD
uniref:Basic tail protein n=1 Tax=Amblyomma maculatum TaxID=34609 RepID=G3MKL0_AMBMU